MPSNARWVYLATAPDQLTAELWANLLQNEGLPVQVRGGDTSSFLGVTVVPCRLMVLEDRLEEARQIMAEELGVEPSSDKP